MATDPRTDDGQDVVVDGRLRSALDAPPHVVGRVVETALRHETRARRRVLGLPRPVVAAAGGMLLLALVVGGLMWPRYRPPLAGARGVITNEGDIVVIKMADRPITLISPAAAASPAPPGTMSIVLLGEAQ